ncbi:MAG: butyrate kinase [Desulfovibrio sp.]|jgi:butyrate kinase|nr:butyrate kinase [Desulfovibrio sp.]
MNTAKHRVLALYPGSAATRVAAYADNKKIFSCDITHDLPTSSRLPKMVQQVQMRETDIARCCDKHGFDMSTLSTVVGRCGPLPPLKQGAYLVDETMLNYLNSKSVHDHPSKLGPLIAWSIAQCYGVQAYVYDSARVDEIDDIARLSGHPELPRIPRTPILNMHAAALKVAEERNLSYAADTFIVAYLGFGICMGIFDKGRMIDYVSDDEGPFSLERSGRLPYRRLINFCFSGRYGHTKTMKSARNKGGLIGYLGTNRIEQVEAMIASGNDKALLAYKAMAYQTAKSIGELSTVVKGKVDRIVLTGELACSALLVKLVEERVNFIAPLSIVPGENDVEALALGALRVLKGEEKAHLFKPCTSESVRTESNTILLPFVKETYGQRQEAVGYTE